MHCIRPVRKSGFDSATRLNRQSSDRSGMTRINYWIVSWTGRSAITKLNMRGA